MSGSTSPPTYAHDLAGRAVAFKAIAASGMDLGRALQMCGLMGVDECRVAAWDRKLGGFTRSRYNTRSNNLLKSKAADLG